MLNVWLETCWFKPPKIDIGNTIKIQRNHCSEQNQTNKSAHRAENAKRLEDRVRTPEVIQSIWA